MLGKLFYFKFVPGDWMKDPELRAVSSGARGLWIDMLSLMFESSRRGYLQFNNGNIVNAEHLARMTGNSTDDTSRWLQELEQYGVFSRTAEGLIYSRRQVRDQAERSKGNERMERFRENGGGDPVRWMAIRVRILERDNYTCAYCGRKASTVDHVIPRSKGGGEDDSNLVGCCKACNQEKSNRTPEEAGMEFWKCDEDVTPRVTRKHISNYNSVLEVDVGSKESKAKPSSKEEVAAYCVSRGNSIDPQQFFDHYTANGWKRGKTRIADWKACVRTWEGRERDSGGTNGNSRESPAEARRRKNRQVLEQCRDESA